MALIPLAEIVVIQQPSLICNIVHRVVLRWVSPSPLLLSCLSLILLQNLRRFFQFHGDRVLK